tara:strand:- start:9950 stop:11440 length:1491 start_codon:yes stop_codon:yes gene_type:complete
MDNVQALSEAVKSKWQPILEHPELPEIKDTYRKNVTAILLENEERALREQAGESVGPLHETTVDASGLAIQGQAVDAAVDSSSRKGFDPVLISLVRRSMPNLMAYDICGVQPMTGPTGLIFALKSHYADSATSALGLDDNEALFDEARASYAGQLKSTDAGVTAANADIFDGSDTENSIFGITAGDASADMIGARMTTATAEQGGVSNNFQEMSFSIEKTAVTAKSRALKAEYTTELAQDLKAVHGLDAETELANILSTEILAEMNREVVRTIYAGAKLGCQQSDLAVNAVGAGAATGLGNGVLAGGTGAGGVYDVDADSDGRWSAERFRGLVFQIEREANTIAKQTRRGKGNFVIVSADVASALSMSGVLDFSPNFDPGMTVDDTGNTLVGQLGNMKVYVDPYATAVNFVCVGYKGTSPYDAGMFYCPYVPLQMVRAVGEQTFQPKIGFKTRYGLVNNPFVVSGGTILSDPQDSGSFRKNQYYRIFKVRNLHGNT